MGIKAQFTAVDVKKAIAAKVEATMKVIEARLTRVGFQFVRDARLKADFTDRTGNLRSSIGFVLSLDGIPISEDFEKSKIGTDKVTGEFTAQEYALSLTAQFGTGYALIVVAGMEYAAAVESRGKDVLTGSSLKAVDTLNKYFKKK